MAVKPHTRAALDVIHGVDEQDLTSAWSFHHKLGSDKPHQGVISESKFGRVVDRPASDELGDAVGHWKHVSATQKVLKLHLLGGESSHITRRRLGSKRAEQTVREENVVSEKHGASDELVNCQLLIPEDGPARHQLTERA